MVSLENFKSTLSLISDFNAKYEKLEDNCIDIPDSWLVDIPFKLFHQWIKSNFNEECTDLIYWWLYDKVDKVITLKNGSKLDVSNIENFYEYLFNNYTI